MVIFSENKTKLSVNIWPKEYKYDLTFEYFPTFTEEKYVKNENIKELT